MTYTEHDLYDNEPQEQWDASDDISIIAMWEGDPGAEVYCMMKANRLGYWPWDNKEVRGINSSHWITTAIWGCVVFVMLCLMLA